MSTTSDTDSESTSSFDVGSQRNHPGGVEEEPGISQQSTSIVARDPIWPRRSSSGASYSSRALVHQTPQTHVESLGHISSTLPSPDLSTDARRQSIMAMDRKRRLTASTQEGGRRRAMPGRFYERDNYPSPRSINPPGPSSHTFSQSYRNIPSRVPLPAPEIIDLTNSPPPSSTNAMSREGGHVMSSQRAHVLPRWQPDSEASECPICKKTFTFLFRRHHCRKCGRVVCNDCSPHRITIPRQFIVNPPGVDVPTLPQGGQTIDLTGDDSNSSDEESPAIFPSVFRRPELASNFVTAGGEKVRLCNPCVPDPQPEPLSSPTHGTLLRSPGSTVVPNRDLSIQAVVSQHHDYRSYNRELTQTAPSTSAPNYAPLSNQYQRSRPHRAHSSGFGPPALLPPVSPSHSSRFIDERQHERPQPLFERPPGGHHRYYSLDTPRSQSSSTGYPRIRSMLNGPPQGPVMFPTHVPPTHVPSALPRPQLREEDICPICRRALPARGAGGDETAREAHIVDCINSRDPTVSSLLSRSHNILQSPPRGPMYMLTFVATEKDCVGDDGNCPECSICMVEYDVGDQLARLECLCKFHKECIDSWFERKQECPVHKIS